MRIVVKRLKGKNTKTNIALLRQIMIARIADFTGDGRMDTYSRGIRSMRMFRRRKMKYHSSDLTDVDSGG